MTDLEGPANRRKVSCYGKLPVHREYLRIGVESQAAAWVVHLIEDTHEALSTSHRNVNAPASPVFAFAAFHPPNPGVVAGVVRQSSDGLRDHPVAFFIEQIVPGLSDAPHLLPVLLAEAWRALHSLADRTFSSLDELNAALWIEESPLALAGAENSYRQAAAETVADGAWKSLTGESGIPARHLAMNLLTVAEAQRGAANVNEGIGAAVPLLGGESDSAARASVWLELFGTTAGTMPTTILVGGTPRRLYVFYRPLLGSDLAPMLAGAAPTVDDLSDEWQVLPPEGSHLASILNGIVSEHAASLTELVQRLRSVEDR